MHPAIAVLYAMVFPGLLFLVSYALFLQYVDRKVLARMQNRVGPPWWQPFAALVKLLSKEDIAPEGTDDRTLRALPPPAPDDPPVPRRLAQPERVRDDRRGAHRHAAFHLRSPVLPRAPRARNRGGRLVDHWHHRMGADESLGRCFTADWLRRRAHRPSGGAGAGAARHPRG